LDPVLISVSALTVYSDSVVLLSLLFNMMYCIYI